MPKAMLWLPNRRKRVFRVST